MDLIPIVRSLSYAQAHLPSRPQPRQHVADEVSKMAEPGQEDALRHARYPPSDLQAPHAVTDSTVPSLLKPATATPVTRPCGLTVKVMSAP